MFEDIILVLVLYGLWEYGEYFCKAVWFANVSVSMCHASGSQD